MIYYLKDKNMSLHEYCLKNGYCYQTIKNYILELGLTYEQAIDRFKIYRGRHDYKTIYKYNGESLMQYCLKHKYNYSTIRFKIVNEGFTVEEAVAYAEKLKQKKLSRRALKCTQ
jgi:lambda repressor-like predicted transcriptional regulator